MNEDEATAVVTSCYDSFYSALVRYAAHTIRDEDLAQDIVQEGFMRLYRALREGHSIESPKAWAFAVVRREAIMRFRERTAERLSDSGLDSLEELPAENWDVIPSTDRPISDMFRILSAREQEAIVLRMEGLKYREIGKQLGLSIPSVGTLLSRALRKLQKVMGPKRMPGEDQGSSHVGNSIRPTLQ